MSDEPKPDGDTDAEGTEEVHEESAASDRSEREPDDERRVPAPGDATATGVPPNNR